MQIPLRVKSDYTLLKSLIKIPDLISYLKENKINICGICDEYLYGVFDFYNACIANSIKPLIALEIHINDQILCLYAKNYDGLKNLFKIHTFKEKGELNLEVLKTYSKEIILLLPSSNIANLSDYDFYETIYISYESNKELENIKELDNKIIYAPSINLLKPEDGKYSKYLDILRRDNKTIEVCSITSLPKNTLVELEFANLIDIKIPFNKRYIPKYNDSLDSWQFLNSLAHKGLDKRLNKKVPINYQKRLEYELSVIKKMGFVDYFLICYDYVLYAKKNNILVGPGRGSAAGSLVSFSIGITDIDPIKYNLLFERFLNPDRITMPDIDIDFDANRRDEVINYVKNKYGFDCVALGLTFTTLKSKLVLREIAKILRINSSLLEMFINEIESNKTLRENYQKESVKKYLNNYKELKELYNISLHLEGLKKNTSTHAAGVVISSIKLDEIIPTHYIKDTMYTGITLDYLENIGLLKMDFLGIKNLSTISNIQKSIGNINLKDIPLDDQKVFELFQSGKTDGIFQFETPLMKELITKLKPTSFNDLVIAIALGRPGPKEHQSELFQRKNGLKKVTYLHPDLENILKETYGIIIYQEQIISILNKIGGFTYAEADVIRRGVSKKKEEVLLKYQQIFIENAKKRGYQNIAAAIYQDIIKFASYGFNKSHSVAYAFVAYQMAYLKTHYPVHFLIEELKSKDAKDITSYFSYLKAHGFSIHKPSINNESVDFYMKGNNLYLPIYLINNISKEIARKIYENKEEKYSDFFDFCFKNKDFIDEEKLKILISAGCFDSLKINKQTLHNNILEALNYALLEDGTGIIKKPLIKEYPEYELEIIQNYELESYGFFISNHPSSNYQNNIMKLNNIKTYAFKKINCVVLIENIKMIKTKKNEDMAFIKASDEFASADFTLFPNKISQINGITKNNLVKITGEVTKRFDKYSIVINNIRKVG